MERSKRESLSFALAGQSFYVQGSSNGSASAFSSSAGTVNGAELSTF